MAYRVFVALKKVLLTLAKNLLENISVLGGWKKDKMLGNLLYYRFT
jgi:hypothetical protein